jgi:hypothetical protein
MTVTSLELGDLGWTQRAIVALGLAWLTLLVVHLQRGLP